MRALQLFHGRLRTNYLFLSIQNSNLRDSAFEDLLYEAIRVGIGASLDYRPVPFNQTWWTCATWPKMWNYTTSSGHTGTMEAPNGAEGDRFIERSIYYLRPDEASSAEFSCATALFILSPRETMKASPSNQQNSLTLYCEPSILIADFEVVFDSQGIVSIFQLSSASNPQDLQMTDSPAIVAHFNLAITGLRKTYPSHRNASFSQCDWPGMLTAFIYNRLTPVHFGLLILEVWQELPSLLISRVLAPTFLSPATCIIHDIRHQQRCRSKALSSGHCGA